MEGSIAPLALESLSGRALTDVLRVYVARATRGIEDAALVIGTSKDLMEAVAAHVLKELWGQYPQRANFPILPSQDFVALDLCTPQTL